MWQKQSDEFFEQCTLNQHISYNKREREQCGHRTYMIVATNKATPNQLNIRMRTELIMSPDIVPLPQ